MQLRLDTLLNGKEEVAAAGAYTGRISIASLQQPSTHTTPPWNGTGCGTYSPAPNCTYLPMFNKVSAGKNSTVAGFSGLCWLTGKAIFEALGGAAPVGLLVGSVGGTPIEAWLPPGVLGGQCPAEETPCGGADDNALYETLIKPLAPFTMGAMLWDQAERDVRCFSPATNKTGA